MHASMRAGFVALLIGSLLLVSVEMLAQLAGGRAGAAVWSGWAADASAAVPRLSRLLPGWMGRAERHRPAASPSELPSSSAAAASPLPSRPERGVTFVNATVAESLCAARLRVTLAWPLMMSVAIESHDADPGAWSSEPADSDTIGPGLNVTIFGAATFNERRDWSRRRTRCLFHVGSNETVTAVARNYNMAPITYISHQTTCPLPWATWRFLTQHGYVNVTLEQRKLAHRMETMPLCLDYPLLGRFWPPRRQFQLGHCAIIQAVNDRLPEWIVYHHMLGVSHFFLYDQAHYTPQNATYAMRRFIDMGLVTVVPWYFTLRPGQNCSSIASRTRPCRCEPNCTGIRLQYTGLIQHWNKEQSVALNDCVKRFGGYMKWIGMYDVDEFMFPRKANCSLLDLLQDRESHSAVFVRMVLWHPPRGNSALALKRFQTFRPGVFKMRNKYFQLAERAGFVSVHEHFYDNKWQREVPVAEAAWFDPDDELVVCHLRNMDVKDALIGDTARPDLQRYLPAVQRRLAELGFPSE